MRLDVGTRAGFRQHERALEHAAIGLRFADRDGEAPVAQIGGDAGTAEPCGCDDHARGREAHVEIEIREPADHNRAAAPVALVGAQHFDGGNVGRDIDRVGRERTFKRNARLGRQRQDALGNVAVQLDIHARERDGAAGQSGLRLQRERTQA